MTTQPDQLALLRSILAAPEDDAPRLVYADWLEEHGEPERAEFIRVQCQLAKMGDYDEQSWAIRDRCPACRTRTNVHENHCRWLSFRRRERELWLSVFPAIPAPFAGLFSANESIPNGPLPLAVVSRGFISTITIPGSELARVVDQVCPDLEPACAACHGAGKTFVDGTVPRPLTGCEQPVSEIRLTNWTEGVRTVRSFVGTQWPRRRWSLILPDDTRIEPPASPPPSAPRSDPTPRAERSKGDDRLESAGPHD